MDFKFDEKLTKEDLDWIEKHEVKTEDIKDKKLLYKIQKYCNTLHEKCKRIQEIDIVGSFVNGGFNSKSDIDLVCIIKDLIDEWEGYNIIHSLLEQTISYWIKLKIKYPIDLGFRLGGGIIFLLGGLISDYEGKFLTIFSIERDIIIDKIKKKEVVR